jgi:hypothetical protein
MQGNQTQEISMPNRASTLALAALATLATAALASSNASAAQFTVNHSAGHVSTHVHLFPPICSSGCGHDHDEWREHDRDDGRWRFGHRPYEGGPVSVASVGGSAPVSAPAPSAGCLTKRELPNGSALFRDLCTQEEAESQPAGGAPGSR